MRQVHRFGMLQRCEDLLIALLSYFQDICLHGRSHTLRYLSSLRFCPSRNSEQSTHANACQKTTRHGPHGTASGLSARDQQTPCSCQRSSVRIWRPLRSQPQCIFCRRHSARGLRPRMAAWPEPGRKRRLNSLQEVGWWGDPERGILAGSQILALGPEAFLEVQLRVRELRARRRRSKQQRREMPPVPHCVVQDGTLVHGNALPCLRLRRLSRRYDEKLM